MPKLKTKSGVKKRFKVTGTGKVLAQARGKRHGMLKRSSKFLRNARGTMVLSDPDIKRIKQFLPYARKPRKHRRVAVAAPAVAAE